MSLRSSILTILIFTLICPNNHALQLFPQRFGRKLPSSHDQRQQKENEICTNFTMEFLKEINDKNSTTSPLFGWISAQGKVPLDNRTAYGINCLALGVSWKDLIVEKRCIRSIYPTALNFSSSNFSIKWPQGNFEDNLKLIQNNEEDDGFGDQIGLFSLPQAHHRHQQKHSSNHNFPCIFPIQDRIANKLAWNATICGIISKNLSNSQNVSKIGCHPLQLNVNFTDTFFVDQNGREFIQKHFLPGSTTFLFDTAGPLNGLSAIGNVGMANNNFHLIGKRECLLLANSTKNRSNCAVQNEQSAEEIPLPSPSIIPEKLFPNLATADGQMSSTAEQSFAMIPLVILLALVISGMFLTIGYFILQKHRQIHYDTI